MYLLFILPALWMCYIAGVYAKAGLVLVLHTIGVDAAAVLGDITTPMALLGVLLTLSGNVALLWEMTNHKSSPYNWDAVATYVGGALVLISFLLEGMPGYLGSGVLVFAVLTLPNSTAYVVRSLYRYTVTAMGSMTFFAVHAVLLLALSKLAVFIGLDLTP